MAFVLPSTHPLFHTGNRRNKGRWTMELETLKDLLVEELKDLYSAENQIV